MFEHLDDPAGMPGRLRSSRVSWPCRHHPGPAGGGWAALPGWRAPCCFGRPLPRPPFRRALRRLPSHYQFNLLRTPPRGLRVPTTAFLDVQFADPEHGFALTAHRGTGLLAASSDGGSTLAGAQQSPPRWSRQPMTVSPGQFEFVGSTGYLWGARTTTGSPLWMSPDDGATWHEAPIGPYVYDVSAINLDVWALTGTCPSLATNASCTLDVEQSIDGGKTWASLGQLDTGVVAPTTDTIQPIELARITTTRAYVLTETTNQGQAQWALSFTSDSGATWSSRPVPCMIPGLSSHTDGVEVAASSTTDLWLICGGTLTAGGQSKLLFRSSDGGQSWQVTASSSDISTTRPPRPRRSRSLALATWCHSNQATTTWPLPTQPRPGCTRPGPASSKPRTVVGFGSRSPTSQQQDSPGVAKET